MYIIFGEPLEQFFGNVLQERIKVRDSLRGWSDALRPEKNLYLPQYVVAGKYCDSGRDVWWKYVKKAAAKKTKPLLQGNLYHEIMAEIIPLAKKYIYNNGAMAGFDILSHLMELREGTIDGIFEGHRSDVMSLLRVSDINEIKDNMRKMWNYQAVQLAASVDMVISKFMRIEPDALVAKAIPVSVEQRLDGSRIGLSRQLSVDALHVPQTVMMDIKTGKPQPFHSITITGYAMAYESEFNRPVDIGCIIYPQFISGKGVPYIEKKLYVIDDAARTEFLGERDRKMKIIGDANDPGLASYCPKSCSYFMNCHPSGEDERIKAQAPSL
ncbi:MAG: type I-A CRISPR-associated protein Cas4/Csa1 [Candidatus Aenigmarchaeota archaeon]|nr:type I-A CRISPR-associated protein Cas4/Csa1 [Candidatus Aenigmarchaeota archaeon]